MQASGRCDPGRVGGLRIEEEGLRLHLSTCPPLSETTPPGLLLLEVAPPI